MCPPACRPMIPWIAIMRTICLLGVAVTLTDCGGSKSSSTSSVDTDYTVGGTITGLTVSSLVLANGSATVTISNGASSWVFPTKFAAGSSYAVTVKTQPVGEQCEITSGASGTNTGNVGNVTVVCSFGQWTWEAGSNSVNSGGVYGTQGTAAAGNLPGARYGSSSWTDSSGNFWLFGGVGYDATGTAGYINDLWRYSPSSAQWSWVSGADASNAGGVYGTLGASAAANVPGARQAASSWIDASGNLWLFGGIGYDATGARGNLNDLWRYSPSSGQWSWVSGGNAVGASGVYGTQGTAAAGNVPGARSSANSWIDSSGNLWLFGGAGIDSTGVEGNLNDLWRYSPGSGQWTWISGGNVAKASGIYGTQGTAATGNVPGGRNASSAWIDSSGNLWLFGGYGYDSIGSVGRLNDLWKYDPSSAQWTWIGGEAVANATGVYGTLGTAASGNLPGSRQAASSWVDGSGHLWLFGGVGYDSVGAVGNLDDLWRYDLSSAEWTWIGGSAGHNVSGVYDTLGTGSPATVPPARNASSSWIDSSGNLWLFGGNGYDASGAFGYLNDLWQYNPSTGT